MVALETRTVLFGCGERERNEDGVKEREGGGGAVHGKAKKGKEMKADWLVEGGWAIFSQHHSLPLSLSLPLFLSLSLSFCFLVPFLAFLCLLKEKAGEEGANVRETERVC